MLIFPIQRSINTQGKVTWSQLATPIYYKPILISVVMRFLQQMTGITPTLVYLETIFSKSNVSLAPRLDVSSVDLLSVYDIIFCWFIIIYHAGVAICIDCLAPYFPLPVLCLSVTTPSLWAPSASSRLPWQPV